MLLHPHSQALDSKKQEGKFDGSIREGAITNMEEQCCEEHYIAEDKDLK